MSLIIFDVEHFFFAICGPLTAMTSPVVEHRLWTHRPSGRGSRAQPLRGMWDPPGSGHEPASLASAGGLSTTAPPGKPHVEHFFMSLRQKHCEEIYLSKLSSPDFLLFCILMSIPDRKIVFEGRCHLKPCSPCEY